ncbi:DUF5667 domain-containing protein [Kallotenue papyrolyticum]|uniref:DUF5667 domain-containing protein n=1 Tax=Kallotenue papyrolyticum TaxID=1325125 RepID=UPI0004926471|nr:DUF5667 domain-containing protein [Kallotenue papyrolyticum]
MLQPWPAHERLDAVLDACIDQLDVLPPERLLLRYPSSAARLAPLLEVARSLRALAAIELEPTARTVARRRLRQAVLAQRQRERQCTRRVRRGVLLCLLCLVLGLSSVTAVAARALPGDRLYGWKRAGEELWWRLQRTPAGRVSVALWLADRRVSETVQMLERGHAPDARLTAGLEQAYGRALEAIAVLPAAEQSRLLMRLHADGDAHVRRLAAYAGQAAPDEQAVLDAALALARWASTARPGARSLPVLPLPRSTPVPTARPVPPAWPEGRDSRWSPAAATAPPVAAPHPVSEAARTASAVPPAERAKPLPQADRPKPPERPRAASPDRQRPARPSPASVERGKGKGRDN